MFLERALVRESRELENERAWVTETIKGSTVLPRFLTNSMLGNFLCI